MIKFEKTRIHYIFKSDFFAAVAVVDAKAPYFNLWPEGKTPSVNVYNNVNNNERTHK